MAETTNETVTPEATETAAPAEAAAKVKPAVLGRAPKVVMWLGLLAVGIAGVVGAGYFSWQEMRTLAQTGARPTSIDIDWTSSNSPDFLEVVAEQALALPVPDEASAYVAAKRATQLDPSRAFAWSTLAYLETRRTGQVNDVALGGLMQSMEACPLCDQELIRWRFNFVLGHWNEIPDPVRRKAFEQADILRWMGDNAEFLAEMRFKAGLQNIPFDDYRAAVDTPARSWDIAPAPAG